MSDNTNNNNLVDNVSIDEIINQFKTQQEQREIREIEPLEPPKKRDELIDFSVNNEEAKRSDKNNSKKKPKKERVKKTAEEKAEIKTKYTNKIKKLFKIVISKKVLLPIIAVVVIIGAVFVTKQCLNYSETAYLRPYTEKYPDVTFPAGIMEKYCDTYGENPNAVGKISISDIGLDTLVDKSKSAPVTNGANVKNYVVYLDDNRLEDYYKNATSYNSSSKAVTYTNWIDDYTFQVIGAFYTNTDEKDDDGYIFPYNVTEEMTFDSLNCYIDRINTRFRYVTAELDAERSDTFLTLSCPTDYKDGYRFVVVCKAVDEINPNIQATDKLDKNIRKTSSEYENINDNPYRIAGPWYPEIVIKNADGTESTVKKTIDDYRQKTAETANKSDNNNQTTTNQNTSDSNTQTTQKSTTNPTKYTTKKPLTLPKNFKSPKN